MGSYNTADIVVRDNFSHEINTDPSTHGP